MAALKDIARETGLSVNTVSRVIRNKGYISERARTLVQDAVQKLGYLPSRTARELRAGTVSHSIALVCEQSDPSLLKKMAAIQAVFSKTPYDVSLFFTGLNADRSVFSAVLQRVLDGTPAGVLLVGESESFFQTFASVRKILPCVSVAPGPLLHADCVSPGSFQAVYDVVCHLYQAGRRRIVFCESPYCLFRKRGYLKAVNELGLEGTVIPCQLKNSDLLRDAGMLNARLFSRMKPPPDAVLASDDMCAGLLNGLAATSLEIPQDIALVGFGNLEFSSMLSPSLSTIAMPDEGLGTAGANLLLSRIRKPDAKPVNLRVPMKFISRKTA